MILEYEGYRRERGRTAAARLSSRACARAPARRRAAGHQDAGDGRADEVLKAMRERGLRHAGDHHHRPRRRRRPRSTPPAAEPSTSSRSPCSATACWSACATPSTVYRLSAKTPVGRCPDAGRPGGLVRRCASCAQTIDKARRPTPATVLITARAERARSWWRSADPSRQSAPRRDRAVGAGQLRGDPGGAHRVRALRAREGELHRSGPQADRKVRRGRRRHHLPRRDRRHVVAHSGQGAARSPER